MQSIITILPFVVNDFSTIHFYKIFCVSPCALWATGNGQKLRSTALPSLTLGTPKWARGFRSLFSPRCQTAIFFRYAQKRSLRDASFTKLPTLSPRPPPVLSCPFYLLLNYFWKNSARLSFFIFLLYSFRRTLHISYSSTFISSLQFVGGAGGSQKPSGKRKRSVARPPRYTVLILHIVLIGFWERSDFSRPDAIFGLFFVVYGLPDIPERVTRYSGTGYQIFRNGLPDIPCVAIATWLSIEFDLFIKFI